MFGHQPEWSSNWIFFSCWQCRIKRVLSCVLILWVCRILQDKQSFTLDAKSAIKGIKKKPQQQQWCLAAMGLLVCEVTVTSIRSKTYSCLAVVVFFFITNSSFYNNITTQKHCSSSGAQCLLKSTQMYLYKASKILISRKHSPIRVTKPANDHTIVCSWAAKSFICTDVLFHGPYTFLCLSVFHGYLHAHTRALIYLCQGQLVHSSVILSSDSDA